MAVLPAGAEDRPNRLIFRCISELLIDELRDLTVRLDHNFYRALIYLAIGQASSGDRAKAISVRAVAQSLRLPYETTRRHVRQLEIDGLVTRDGEFRVLTAPSGSGGGDLTGRDGARLVSLQKLFADLMGLGLAMPRPVRRAAFLDDHSPRQISHLVDGLILRVIEGCAFPHESILDAYIYTALMTLNAAPITYNTELAGLYGRSDTPPPDNLRRAVSIGAVARRTGLVHETVRRRLIRQRALGRCEQADGGHLASMAFVQTPEILRAGQVAVQRFLQFAPAVQAAGLDLDRIPPSTRYEPAAH